MRVVIKWAYSVDRPSHPWFYSISFFDKKKEGHASTFQEIWRIIDVFIAEQVVHS